MWLDLTPLLRGPEEWRWSLRAAQPGGRLVLPIVLLGAYVLACNRWLSRWDEAQQPRRSVEWSFFAFLTLAAPLIQFALAAAVLRNAWFEFFAATVSPAVTGYYSVAVTTPDLPTVLPRYTELMPTLPIHPQTHPPGLVLIHWLAWRTFEAMPAVSDAIAMPLRALQCHNVALMTLDNPQIASSTIGMLVPLLGGLAVWPIYAFGKRIAGPPAATTVAAIFPILPLYAMWSSQWDQVYPLLLFTALYLAHTGLEAGSPRRLFAAGIPLSLATFLSIGNVVLVFIVGLYATAWSFLNRSRRWLRLAIAFLMGCLSIWTLYAALYRVSVSDLLAVASRLAFEGTRCPVCPSTTRSYATWIVWNPIDFATFFSIPLTILLLVRIPAMASALRLSLSKIASRAPMPGSKIAGRAPMPGGVGAASAGHFHPSMGWVSLVIAASLPFAALVISGIVRGEVGRMWGYFGPLFLLIALAPHVAPAIGERWLRGATILVGLIALQLLVMYTRWQVTPSFLDEPPERAANFVAPQPQVEMRASFGRQIALLGYDLSRAGDRLDLTLYWQALAQLPHAYTVFVHVFDAEGRLAGQQDNMPVRDQLPTSCWQPGEIVADPYAVEVHPDTAEPLSLEVGLYRLDTGERLDRDDGSEDKIMLAVP